MTIWCIRYADRNGRKHSLFHEQDVRPSEVEALAIVIDQLHEFEEAQSSHGTDCHSGLSILGVDEFDLKDLSGAGSG